MFEWLFEFPLLWANAAVEFGWACLADWAAMKPARFCYAGLAGLYLAEVCGVHDRRVFALGLAMYLALYLA